MLETFYPFLEVLSMYEMCPRFGQIVFLHNRLLSNGLCIGDEGDFLSCQDERDFEGWKRLESFPSLVSGLAFGVF